MCNLEFRVKCQTQYWDIFLNVEIPTSIKYLWTPNTGFYDIYYQRYRIESFSSCLSLNFKVKGQSHDISIYFYEFRDISSVVIDTKISFYVLYYKRYHIECVVMFDLKFQGQRWRLQHWFIFCESRDINLVLIDTTHKFLRYILQEISYWMRYVMFDLEFQDQRSRSQPWDLFV